MEEYYFREFMSRHHQDGIQDFDFVAEAPTGIVLWVMSVISGDGDIVLESWMKGARVHSATNSITVLLNEAACAVGQGTLENHFLQTAYFFDPGAEGGGGGVPCGNPPIRC